MGRPTKLDAATQKAVTDSLRVGNTRKTAAVSNRIGYSTFLQWMANGSKPRASKLYQEFREAVELAEAQCEARMVALVSTGAAKDPKHARWWLERRKPDDWKQVQGFEHSGPDGGPIPVKVEAGDELSDFIGALKETGLLNDSPAPEPPGAAADPIQPPPA